MTEKQKPPTAEELAQRLMMLLECLSEDNGIEEIEYLLQDAELEDLDNSSVYSFKDAGYMTRDDGIELTFNGTSPRAQFQITITDSSSRL